MPITLGCPSCSKRFRARDESAGKRVRCPHCSAAVPVPTAPDAAAGPTAALPNPPKSSPAVGPARGAAAGPPAPVASPDDWGAADPPKPPAPAAARATSPPAAPAAALEFPKAGPRSAARPAAARPAAASKVAAPGEGAKTPDQLAAPGWRRTRAGLFWVLFGLLLLALPGFVGFAKVVCARSGVELPRGPGDDWVSIAGYVNTNDPNSVRLSKEEMIDAAAYGLPVLLGGLCLAFGRATCGAAPRSSGAKGLFALSGLLTFATVAALVVAAASDKLLFTAAYRYAALGFLIAAALAEFWFLTGLASAGSALRRPRVARAVGLVGFVFALVAVAATVGWEVYAREYRPKPVTEDVRLYEQAGVMLGWLVVVGVYWRAVRGLRGAITDFLTTVEEG